MIPSDDVPEAVIIRPTKEQAAEGLARLELCFPHWKGEAGLLIVKPDFALIVAATECEADKNGFGLRLAVTEKLLAPSGFKDDYFDVGCGWNQPYMSFDEKGIHAPYSFSLYIGQEGVDRAREAFRIVTRRTGPPSEHTFNFAVLRWCFDATAEQQLEQLREWARDAS